ncbi:hypothetical protein ACWDNT_16590 [Streptomyces sp. NPDC000963]|uniref:hypothetical protein n=1 Tax=unclassified Streptomyces TaxID=2593676 RepID=UPI0013936AA6|nr:hypothetical protein [Streptomyces sp. WAC08241]MYV69695.1 hypothetical protein [Streptomyces sp. SID2131]
MSKTPEPAAQTADPAVINCRIRALLGRGELTGADREEYARLLLEWEAAVRAEQELAA